MIKNFFPVRNGAGVDGLRPLYSEDTTRLLRIVL